MSFFYLEGYDQNKPESFLTLYDILRISKPNMVALQISEKEYNEIYQPVVLHPKFEDAMRKVEYLTKLKNVEELKNMKGISSIDSEKDLIDHILLNRAKIRASIQDLSYLFL